LPAGHHQLFCSAMQSGALLLINALLLGLRHGVDWDHLAAISDIVGTACASGGHAEQTFPQNARESIKLSTCYAVGHAAIVAGLGTAVIFAGNMLPEWVDHIAQKAIGFTLVALGGWLIYSARKRLHRHKMQSQRYGVATSIGVGMVHGIGAETGTQMLLLATVGGSADTSFAFLLLLMFVLGLLISNTGIALASLAGFTTTARFRRLSALFAFVTAAFSICFGLSLLL